MAKWILIITSIFLCCFSAAAQTVLMEESVSGDSTQSQYGKNLKHYQYWIIGYGFVVGDFEKDGADIKYGNSSNLIFGVRYKRKISRFYAIGSVLSYQRNSFHLLQDSAKMLPNEDLHDKERIFFNSLNLEIYQRINFGRRGNVIGRFIDIGGYGEWVYSSKHHYKDKHNIANSAGASKTGVTNSNLLYTNDVNYGVMARVGYNRYTLYGKYRYSDVIREDYVFPEFPRLVIGLEIGLYY